jgi:hypothetical protein
MRNLHNLDARLCFHPLCFLLKTWRFASNYLIKLRKLPCSTPKAELKMEHFAAVYTEETGKMEKIPLH